MKTLNKIGCAAILTGLTIGASVNVEAVGFRYGNKLVDIGNSQTEVRLKCGELTSQYAFCRFIEDRREGNDIVPVCERVEEWTYLPGSGRFITTISFERGEVRSFRYGERIP